MTTERPSVTLLPLHASDARVADPSPLRAMWQEILLAPKLVSPVPYWSIVRFSAVGRRIACDVRPGDVMA